MSSTTLRDLVRALFCSQPRVTSVVSLLVGVIGAVHLIDVFKTGSRMAQNDTYYIPVMLLLGLVGLIEPNIWLAFFADREHPVPARYKWLAYGTIAVSVLVYLYLKFVVFRDWKSVPLSEMGNRS